MPPQSKQKRTAVKPAKTVRKRKAASENESVDSDGDEDDRGSAGSQDREMEQLESTVKRMKKQSAAHQENYTRKFDKTATAEVNMAIGSLEGRFSNMMKKAKKAETMISKSQELNNDSEDSHRELLQVQSVLYKIADDLIKAHEPIQSAVNNPLEYHMTNNSWEGDGNDAVRALDLLREDAQKTLDGMIAGSIMTDKEAPAWGTASRVANSGIRRSLKDVPVTPAKVRPTC